MKRGNEVSVEANKGREGTYKERPKQNQISREKNRQIITWNQDIWDD